MRIGPDKQEKCLDDNILRICIILIVAVVLIFAVQCQGATVSEIAAKQRKVSEYEIKAVYLYNFALFVEWPEDEKKKELTIGILGRDKFGDSFNSVKGKKIKNKQQTLRIKRFGRYNNKLDISKCDLLFVCKSESQYFKKIITQLKGKPILTVADTKGFLEKGGMINLVKIATHIKWEINHTAAKQVKLCMNSQLLRNATRVLDVKRKSKKVGISKKDPDNASTSNGYLKHD